MLSNDTTVLAHVGTYLDIIGRWNTYCAEKLTWLLVKPLNKRLGILLVVLAKLLLKVSLLFLNQDIHKQPTCKSFT